MERPKDELTRMRERISKLERMVEGLKGTERALIKSEEETWQLFEEAPNAYQSLDSRGHILRVNRAWMDMLGYTRRDVIGKWFGDFLSPEAGKNFKKRFERFKREGVARGVEFNIKRKDGSLLNVSIDGRIATGDRGRFRHSHCIMHDISARKRAEEIAGTQQERLAKALECSADLIVIVDLDGKLKMVNRAYVEATGYAAEELIGKDFTHILLQEHASEAREIFRGDIMRQGSISGQRMDVVTKDGNTINLVGSATVVFDENGNPSEVLLIGEDVTDSTRTQVALRESEDRLRAVFESSPESITIIGIDGTILACNQATEDISGLSSREMIGKSFRDLGTVMEEDVEGYGAILSRLIGGEKVGPVEGRIIRKDGETRWVEISASPLKKGDEVYGVQVVTRDITESKHLEMLNVALRDLGLALSTASDLEEGLRTCLEAVLRVSEMDCGGIYIIDETSGALVLAYHHGLSSEFVKAVSCYDADSENTKLVMSGQPVYTDHLRLGVPPYSTETDEKLRGVAVLPVSCEGRIIGSINLASHTVEKVPAWSRASLEAISAEIGSAIVRLRVEQALRESEKRFSDIAANAMEWIWAVDTRGCYTYSSPLVEKILGYTPEEVIGKFFYDFFPLEEREGMKQEAFKVFARKEPFREFINRNIHTNGEERWLSTSGIPILDNDGRLLGYRGADTDITERKRAEEALKRGEEQIRRYSEDLEDMVRERTARIHELEHQRAESEKLAATGRMAARIAHEINNPLGGIKNSFLLLKDIMDKEHPHYAYAERVEGEIDRIAGIVRRMFDFYRPGKAGAVDVSISKTISDVVAILESTSRAAEVTMSFDVPEEPITATLPGGYVNQIMFNLIRNAIEASRAGTAVDVSAGVEGDTAVIRVRDEGQGIPEEITDRVFEPFFTTKDRTGINGLGLGLSVSKGMVELMGGSIAFESASDTGTTFTVTLPITKHTEEV